MVILEMIAQNGGSNNALMLWWVADLSLLVHADYKPGSKIGLYAIGRHTRRRWWRTVLNLYTYSDSPSLGWFHVQTWDEGETTLDPSTMQDSPINESPSFTLRRPAKVKYITPLWDGVDWIYHHYHIYICLDDSFVTSRFLALKRCPFHFGHLKKVYGGPRRDWYMPGGCVFSLESSCWPSSK